MTIVPCVAIPFLSQLGQLTADHDYYKADGRHGS